MTIPGPSRIVPTLGGPAGAPAGARNEAPRPMTFDQVGWRFAVGAALIVGGYGTLAILPFVAAAGLAPGVKATLSTMIAVTPPLSKIAAVAVMGKPGFVFLKQRIAHFVHRVRPTAIVGPLRYRIGLVLFVLPFLLDWLQFLLPPPLGDWRSTAVVWGLVGDVMMLASLFVLGGDFWDKLRALFVYDAKAPAARPV